MTEPKLVSPTANVADGERDPDEFDPVSWWEGTGEDEGLPDGFLAEKAAALDAAKRKIAEAKAAAEG